MKSLYIKSLILLTAVLLASIGLNKVYESVTDKPNKAVVTLFKKPALEQPYQLVALGNSHSLDGFDFSYYDLPTLKLTSAAQRLSYDLLELQHHEKQIADDAIILINVSPISFSHKIADRNDGLQYNYFDTLPPWKIPQLQVGDYLQKNVLPMLRAGYLLRREYARDVLARISEDERSIDLKIQDELARAGTPSDSQAPAQAPTTTQEEIERRKYIVANIEASLGAQQPNPKKDLKKNAYTIFAKWYESDEFNPKYFEQNSKDLLELLSYIEDKGWRPVLLTVPVSQKLEQTLYPDYMQVYLRDNMAVLDVGKVPYFDYTLSNQIKVNDSFFDNADHLSEKGAAAFSFVLLQDLIEAGYLDASVDEYIRAQ